MNRFEHVCDNCPLRTKVDVARASESMSMGSSGVRATLSDGTRRYEVVIVDGEVNDSDTARHYIQHQQAMIDTCEGPITGNLRNRCEVGLAKAWRWAEVVGIFQPNISSAPELLPLLVPTSWQDAMPHFDEPTWLVGDPREFSQLECGDHSGFSNYGIKKLTQTVRGTGAELKKGQAVMFDRKNWEVTDSALEDVCRIRVAQGGPQFAFHSSTKLNYNNEDFVAMRDQALAEGIYAYLNSTPDTVKQSDELIATITSVAVQRWRDTLNFLQSDKLGEFMRGFGRANN